MHVHATAVIDPAATIGANVRIGPGVVVGPDVTIGPDTVIGPHAVIHPYTTMGPGCRIHAGAVIGDIPQDLAFKDVVSRVRIGARCILREGVTIHRGTKEASETVVGDDCYLMANSHLAHNVKLGNRVILANGVLLGGYVEIDDGAFVSGNAVVHQFCRIGRLAMVGGISGVGKDVPPFCMTRSGSVNTVIGLNIVGLRRNGFSPEQRQMIRACFHTVYREGLNVSQAVDVLKSRTDPLAREWADFISQAKRGICKGSFLGADEE
ncbi:MAG TPA: acyl-ACP--UDP-N-acetylglucosamine O-acyltransferase [Kiritimatiellia bacterium]|nr:acyl-ACP--UDP-N-acetylglucosamine O-acyltransferase [Kiritimatiellia bacterium]